MSELARLAGGLAEPERRQIQQILLRYARAAIDEEWDSLTRGEASARASDAIDALWQSLWQIWPSTEREKAHYVEALTQLTVVNHARQLRLFESGDSVAILIWTVLCLGGAITVAFSFLFGVRSVYIAGGHHDGADGVDRAATVPRGRVRLPIPGYPERPANRIPASGGCDRGELDLTSRQRPR